jgi:hypothetical protein
LVGTTPAVLTETVYALAYRKPVIIAPFQAAKSSA